MELTGVAAENLQARVRGTLLMGLSNQHGHLLLTTGNKSEVAVGYSTLYGDSAGGFAPIKDVPKTLVWELARWRNALRPRARRDRADPAELASTSRRRPSSRPARSDTDSLPSYEELDAIVADYVDRDLGMAELLERGHDAEVGGPGAAAGGHRRVQAPPVRAGNEDQPEGVRPGSAAADHQPLAGEPAQRPRRSGITS